MCICVASIILAWVAWLLTTCPATANATPVGALIYIGFLVGRALGLPDVIRWLPEILWASAALSLTGTLFRLGWIRLALFLPENLILGCMATGGVIAAVHGSYLDGTIKPWQHISADQAFCLGFYIVHLSAIWRRAGDTNRYGRNGR